MLLLIFVLYVALLFRKIEEYIPPPGYTECYDKNSGLIHYIDNVNNVIWFTNLDDDGNLYFYREDREKSAWQLPPVRPPNIIQVRTLKYNSP